MELGVPSDLIAIAIVAFAAMACGIAFERLGQPAVVGYILAGAILGPGALGLVRGREAVDLLAELGVLLLLYEIGMELPLRVFRRLWRIAVLATAVQIAASTGVMLLIARVAGWPLAFAVLLGFVVALSSTAVAVKVLIDIREIATRAGRITLGVLIAQDLAVVPMMLTVNALAGEEGFHWLSLAGIAAATLFLALLIAYLAQGRRVRLPLLTMVAGHPDLTPLAALFFCFAAAAASGLAGLSAAYGAFLAGLVVGASTDGRAMLEATRPIRSILLMVFFLSVGLLLDPAFIWEHLGRVLTLLFLVAVFKTVLNVAVLRTLGQAWPVAFLAGAAMAQIGEFSFVLSLVGVDARVISREDSRLVVAVTALSLALSPLWVVTARRLHGLAAAGRKEAGEILGLLYGREAEALAETLDEARSRTRILAWRFARAAAGWRRRRADAPAAAAGTGADPPRAPAAAAGGPDGFPGPGEGPSGGRDAKPDA
jgi:CPA2 family monovalent cation:H+ antiporter-2